MTTTSKILYADDDSDDRFIMHECLLSNGQDSIYYIEQTPRPLPSLVNIGLNMPKMDGKENLRYQSIPVIIRSTSENKKEKDACAAQGAQPYFVKPGHMAGYNTILWACWPYVCPAENLISNV